MFNSFVKILYLIVFISSILLLKKYWNTKQREFIVFILTIINISFGLTVFFITR